MELQVIQHKIYEVRGLKIMLDFDLAELYETETRILKQSVKRNLKRFPKDFMFQLTKNEWTELITNCDKFPKRIKHNPSTPFAFTEQGVAMLSGILNSDKAINVNIAIMRAFVCIRKYALNYKDLAEKIATLEQKHNRQFSDVYEALNLLLGENEKKVDWKNRKKIGYK